MRTYEGIPSNSWNNNEDRNESVCLSANRCSIVKENETQILFPFFVFFFLPGRKRNSNSPHALRFFFVFFFVTFKKTDFNFLFRFTFSYGIFKTEYKSFCAFRFRPMAVKVIIFV